MSRIRGEEQPGFVEILRNWLPHQPWFPAPPGRRKLSRVGGLRLPTPPGDADSGLFLELHIFEIEQSGGSVDQQLHRIAVPLTLRSRPSALAGKSAFIGKLTTDNGEDLWVYDGARDRAFLAAWLEMARRQQGSRNGRSRGQAFAGFAEWTPFDLQMQRESVDSPLPHGTRTLVTPESANDDDWAQKVAVDFLRRPALATDEGLETVMTLTTAHSRVVPRVLGAISVAWEDREHSTPEIMEWQTGLLGVIREAGAEAPDAHSLARSALKSGKNFSAEVKQLGRTLGTFHADLAGSFGAYPQSAEQLRTLASVAQRALADQWAKVQDEFDADEAADLSEVIDLMTLQLRDAEEPLMLQTIHGSLGLENMHQLSEQRWVISEAGETVQHSPGLRDVVTMLMSSANVVMEVASQAPSSPAQVPTADHQAADGDSETSAETSATESVGPVNFGRWYEQLQEAFLKGYRSSEANAAGIDSVFFRVAMLTEALELFSQWQGRWVFRPSMLLQVES